MNTGNKEGSVDAVLSCETGDLVNPDDPDEIKKKILQVLNGKVYPRLVDEGHFRDGTLEVYRFKGFKEKVREVIEGHQNIITMVKK